MQLGFRCQSTTYAAWKRKAVEERSRLHVSLLLESPGWCTPHFPWWRSLRLHRHMIPAKPSWQCSLVEQVSTSQKSENMWKYCENEKIANVSSWSRTHVRHCQAYLEPTLAVQRYVEAMSHISSHDLSSKAQDYWQAYSDSTEQGHHRRRSQLPWVANGKAWQILSSIWLLADQLFLCSISDHQTAPEKFSLTVSPSIRNHPQQGMNRKKDERGKCVRQAEWKASFKVGTSRKSTMNFRDSSTKPNFTGAVDSKRVEFAVSLEVGRWFTFIQLVVRRTPRNASQYDMTSLQQEQASKNRVSLCHIHIKWYNKAPVGQRKGLNLNGQ